MYIYNLEFMSDLKQIYMYLEITILKEQLFIL